MLTLYSQLHALEISKASASSGQLTLLELMLSITIKDETHRIISRLTYNRRKLTKRLKLVLMKCSNIKSVKFNIEVESEVLSLIGRYCPNISH